MEDKKIIVLLSAYNGELYVAEQIESILQQTWKNVEIYVRDDGSSDGTGAILKQYEAEGKIRLEMGKNVGFIKSFFWLVEHCGEADYYAYADQDDVWFPDKLAMAMELLEKKDAARPLLYFSNYDYYDGQLNFVSHQKDTKKHPTFANALVDCMPLGFNSVFNRTACELMKQHIPQASCGHDWWTYLVCQGLGEVIYDRRPTVKYRRHEGNASPGGMAFFKHQIWRIRKFFGQGYFANVHKMLQEYEKYYKGQLSRQDQKLLRLFTQDGFHPVMALKKVFYPHKFRQTVVDELMVRVVFLIGKL